MDNDTEHMMTENASPAVKRSLDRLFSPSAIAVIGASNSVERIGGTIFANLKRAFVGELYPVHPREDQVQGVRAYRSLADIPLVVDLVLIAVGADDAVDLVVEAGKLGIGAAVVITAGFAESGSEGGELQQRLVEATRQTGIRVLGPNCIGFMNFWNGAIASFALSPQENLPAVGSVALVSQSGGFGSYIASKAFDAGLRLGCVVSTGNEVDVDVAAVLEHLVELESVHVLLAFAEALKDPVRFQNVARRAREKDKPLVVLKAGRSDVAARAAMSHTASVVGSAAVFDAVVRQCGAIVAETMEELLDFGILFQDRRRVQSRNVAIVSTSGGAGVLAADEADLAGLFVPTLSEGEQSRVMAVMPQPFFGSLTNPIDTTAQVMNRQGAFADVLKSVAASPEIDMVVPVIWSALKWHTDAVIDLHKSTTKPVAVLTTTPSPELMNAGAPAYTDPRRLMRALAALATISQTDLVRVMDYSADGERQAKARALLPVQPETPTLMEHDGKALLATYGVPVTIERLVASKAEAVDVAKNLPGAVVLKAMSYQLPHKSDAGAVRVGLRGERAVAEAYEHMLATVAQRAPHAKVVGVLVQEMVPSRIEINCGMSRDPMFGPIVAIGLGGIFVEILAQAVLLKPPFDKAAAIASVGKLCGGRLVGGARGLSPEEADVIAAIAVALGQIALELPEIEEVDINPVRVDDGKAIAADALVVLASRFDATTTRG
jgi:acetate---CoA ligase (ADP-forming)